MKRRLPIGIQDFTFIREKEFVYVDKTARIHQLISGSGKQFFLSRPRRFGKSLLCSTLCAIFEGQKELFGETAGYPALAINSLDWEWKKYPVIRIDLNPGDYKAKGTDMLNEIINLWLESCAKKYSVSIKGENSVSRFFNLIETLHDKYNEKVVVIIDEYDKPLLNTFNAPSVHVKLRDALKGFYGVLKSADQYLHFVLLTGVSKFSHVSIFSDLNQLVDLSLDPRYADICGFTQEEIEQNFEPEIQSILHEKERSRDEYFNNLRRFYNGYRFSKKLLLIYNPFGLLNHFELNGDFMPYWYETATPSFLIDLIVNQKINILELSNLKIKHEDFCKYDIENMKAQPLLYQTGYLTISDYDNERNLYTLDYPNEEVRASFANSLLKQYLQISSDNSGSVINTMIDAIYVGNVEN